MEAMTEAPRTRSELLAARRAESAYQLQSRYNQWEGENPAWARRLTGPAAASALGYGKGGMSQWESRAEMMHARKVTQREAAMRCSGFDDITQKKLTSHEPNTLLTSISRPTVDPSLAWHQEPVTQTRSQLRAERRADNVRTLDAATEKNERDGTLGAEARVQRRIDQAIVYVQAAPVGESREALMQRRRNERAHAALSAYQAYQPPQPPKFADQAEPFWKVQREKGDGRQPREYASLRRLRRRRRARR